MHQPKVPKREKEYTGPFVRFSGPQTPDFVKQLKRKKVLKIISIDPGTVNLAFRIEKRYQAKYPRGLAYRVETISFELRKFDIEVDKYQRCPLYRDVTKFFQEQHDKIKGVDLVMIERQPPINYKTVRLSQHMISYFSVRYPDAHVIDIDPRLKGASFGLPKGTPKPELKKWAIAEAGKLLRHHDQDLTLLTLRTSRKKDDLADTVVQVEGFCRLTGLAKTIYDYDDDIVV